MKTNFIICLFAFLTYSLNSIGQVQNTYPYPSSANVGLGTIITSSVTNNFEYKLSVKGILYPIGEETQIATIPFRIIAEDWQPASIMEPGLTDLLSEAFVFPKGESIDESVRVYSLYKNGSLVLGEVSNSLIPTNSSGFAPIFGLISDNSIHSKSDIYSDNKIGIGTTNPATALDIHNGNVTLNDNKIFLRADGFHYLSFDNSFAGATFDGPLLTGYSSGILGTTDMGEKAILYWSSNGRVGINTTTPSSEFEVNGDVTFGGSNPDDLIKFESHTGYRRISFNDLRLHEFSFGDVLTINNGNLGVNNSNPNEKLDITGNLRISNAANEDVLTVWNTSSSSLNFKVKGDGRVYAREIEVMLGAFPDYVFDEDYKLMNLSELDVYIKKNKHLPGIESAESIDQNGLGLGELSRIQMEKIEELTLYLIDQNKMIEKLQERVLELENKR